MNTAMVLGLGVLLGMQHATEADHLAAVAALVGRGGSLAQGLRHGAAWGLGHLLTLVLVAAGFGLLGWVVSPELAGRFEMAVGAMLVALGLHLLWRLWHALPAGLHAERHAAAPRLPARTLLVGMVHGLAGSAALVLLASHSMPSAPWQLVYIALFGAGSLLGMALLSGALALSLRLTARRLQRLHRVFSFIIAAVSVAVGARLLWVSA